MTKDSICKDYVSRKCFVYELKGVQREERSCNKMAAAGDASGDVKVLKCSEYERIQIRKKERNKKMKRMFFLAISGGARRAVTVLHFQFEKSRQLFSQRIGQKICVVLGGQSSIRKGHLILTMQDGIGN